MTDQTAATEHATRDFDPTPTKGRAAFEANRGNTDSVGEIAAYEYLRNWHDDVHAGAVQHCLREPCYGLADILRH